MNKISGPFPEMPKISKSRRKIFNLRILMKSFTYAFAIIGLLFILLAIVIIGFLRTDATASKDIPQNAILYVNFDDMISEVRTDDLISELSEIPSISFYDLIKSVNVAAIDPRVSVLLAEINDSGLGLAQIQELRNTIKRFRSTGKKAYIYSSGMGNFGGGTGEYYLASAFDEIWMQPNTEIGITGISMEIPFARNVLEKIGVQPEFYTRYEYKSAVSSLVNSGFSKEHREETLKLGQNLFDTFIRDAGTDRGMASETLKKMVDDAPLVSEDGLNNGLINMVAYKPDMIEEIKYRTNGAEMINVHDYLANLRPAQKNVPTIAFLVIDGTIMSGRSMYNPVRRDMTTGAATVAQYLEKISQNPDVKALVLRINSPGGSYNAANEIWYAVKKLKAVRNIPVVVSQGDYAASGGYFISLAGDYIFTEPSTITGSIGVLGGKMVLAELWKKLGLNWEQVNFGKNAGMLTANRAFNESEKNAFNRSLDRVYDDFTKKVSQTRGISLADLDRLARGRVWTGSQAVEYKLADELGGIGEAVEKAMTMAGIGSDGNYTVIYYPEPKTFAEKLNDIFSNTPGVSSAAAVKGAEMLTEELLFWRRLNYDAVLPPIRLKN